MDEKERKGDFRDLKGIRGRFFSWQGVLVFQKVGIARVVKMNGKSSNILGFLNAYLQGVLVFQREYSTDRSEESLSQLGFSRSEMIHVETKE